MQTVQLLATLGRPHQRCVDTPAGIRSVCVWIRAGGLWLGAPPVTFVGHPPCGNAHPQLGARTRYLTSPSAQRRQPPPTSCSRRYETLLRTHFPAAQRLEGQRAPRRPPEVGLRPQPGEGVEWHAAEAMPCLLCQRL